VFVDGSLRRTFGSKRKEAQSRQLGLNVWEAKLCLSQARTRRGVIEE
jgi:hypothetical protein